MCRAAFADESDCQRVRIVSRKTIGRHGGLVITRNLRSYYCERFALGKHRQEPREAVTFIPSLLKRLAKPTKGRKKATISITERGTCVGLDHRIGSSSLISVLRKYQDNSRISDEAKTFAEIGIRIEANSKRLRILSGSPESQIRLMGYMADSRCLMLAPGPESDTASVCIIPLLTPDSARIRVPVIECSSEYSCPWVTPYGLPKVTGVPDKQLAQLGRWMPLPQNVAATIWDKLI